MKNHTVETRESDANEEAALAALKEGAFILAQHHQVCVVCLVANLMGRIEYDLEEGKLWHGIPERVLMHDGGETVQ